MESKCKLCGSAEDVSYQNTWVAEGIERAVYCNDAVKCWNRWNKEHLEPLIVELREKKAVREITKLAGGK